MRDRVFLRGIQLFARHGLYEEEHRLGQRFVIDADWWVEPGSFPVADDYNSAVGYQHVFEVIREVVTERQYSLIETLAEAIADTILERFRPIETVRVEVHKPAAPIAGIFGDVGVEVTRKRPLPPAEAFAAR